MNSIRILESTHITALLLFCNILHVYIYHKIFIII